MNIFSEFGSYLVDDAKINGSSLYTGVESSSAAPSSRVKSSLGASTSREYIGQIR